MGEPLTASGSASSELFGSQDSAFLDALRTLPLPGEETQVNNVDPSGHPNSKRERSEDLDLYDEQQQTPGATGNDSDAKGYLNSDTYGASRFGEFGEYMRRKRAKLQIQNSEMDIDGEDVSNPKSRIFRGLAIYINGWTEPSVQDLRQLIIQHGGVFHPYLDRKSLVTHIITCSLTPAKIKEFKHMKVVRPEWLVESAKAGMLLSWKDFIFRPGERVESSQGRKSAQTSLLSGLTKSTQSILANLAVPAGPSSSAPRTPPQTLSKRMSSPEATPVASTSNVTADSLAPHTPKITSKPKYSSSTSSPSAHYTTDPATMAEATTIPGYSAFKSNEHAQRAMADPAWRAAHTAVAPDFIEGYYKNSRLHHLSTWKAELKGLVQEAQERAERGFLGLDDENTVEDEGGNSEDSYSMRGTALLPSLKGKGKAADALEERVIMHCDFDCFFVSAGLVDRPHLKGRPVVVCHSQGNQGGMSSTSEIASASYEAREFGIKGGMSLQQARRLCSEVVTIPYEFEKYKKYSLQFYTILMSHADDLQAVSVDEALIDVSSTVAQMKLSPQGATSEDPAKDLAELIRAQVRKTTSCEVSIGISHNILLSRVATRRAKPANSYHLLANEVSDFLAPLEIDDLHGFGYKHRQKAQEKLGTTVLGELAKKSKGVLCDALGKSTGETLYKALRGVDGKKLESDKPRKSVSCEINYGIRFQNNEEAEKFMYQLAEEVGRRLDKIDMKGRSMTVKIMKRDSKAPVEPPKFMGHGACDIFNKQCTLIVPRGQATSDPQVIGEQAWRILKAFNFEPKELRGIGIQIQKLERCSAAAEPEPGQAKLQFQRLNGPSKTMDTERQEGKTTEEDDDIYQLPPKNTPIPAVIVDPEKRKPADAPFIDLPSFSQVDKSVFDALPDDVRQELEREYKRRSKSPAPFLIQKRTSRTPSVGPSVKSALRITVKGTKPVDVKRITKQLAPRNRAVLSPAKNKLFGKRDTTGPSLAKVSDAELKKLGLDSDVFSMLPADLQREQLAGARQAQHVGKLSLKVPLKPRRVTRSPTVKWVRPPFPKAKYVPLPTLKQQGRTKGDKLYFIETDDVQNVIEKWVEGFREYPPNQQDVEYFAKWLVRCVETMRGMERALDVARWWLVLLRRYFGVWEDCGEDEAGTVEEGRVTSQMIGKAWWKAFREVKEKMDAVARKKYGGCLSLK
ncbi:DNA repair protein [Neolentinus lepideus HHB14362 ss-1]|uniref:DNA repair protein REV1 n=1 Tax=Neolentinus lepideus HHB14362 ss-1 TaxID=1314782 RepID=A0A165RLY5_9AGAM|nr:DNA repair protein [Neolentinus lepideus HHB14362 ss-1]